MVEPAGVLSRRLAPALHAEELWCQVIDEREKAENNGDDDRRLKECTLDATTCPVGRRSLSIEKRTSRVAFALQQHEYD